MAVFNFTLKFQVPADQLDVTAISIGVNANKKAGEFLNSICL